MNGINLLGIFATGLLTGGITCIAVQGGLLTAAMMQKEAELTEQASRKDHLFPLLSFLAGKIFAYTLLGFLLGYLGSFFSFSIQTQILLQWVVVIFMVGTIGNLLSLHPIFRYFALQPPRFLSKFIYKTSRRDTIFTPALLGILTIFIPCGTTQAIMALSVGTASPFLGALILFLFTLGTSPVFFLIGYFTTRIKTVVSDLSFSRVAASFLLLFTLYNVNNVLTLSNSPITIASIVTNTYCFFSYCDLQTLPVTPITNATITISSSGYSPRNGLAVKAGSHVTLHLKNIDSVNCAQAFSIPSLNLEQIVPVGQEKDLAFTAPGKKGEIAFMCSEGNYRGTIQVI